MSLSSVLFGPNRWCKKMAYSLFGHNTSKDVFIHHKEAKCCLHGATALDPETEAVVNDALKAAIKKLGWADRAIASKWGLIAGFNDHPDTTWEDVQCVIAESELLLQS